MARNREDLIQDVLSELRVNTQGSPASAEEEDIVARAVDPFIAQLRVGRIYPNASADLINDSEYYPFTILLAERVQKRFGKVVVSGMEKATQIAALRRQNKQPLNANPLSVDRALLRPSREPWDGR